MRNSDHSYSVCQQYLNIIYQNASVHHVYNISDTYGEILYPSVHALLSMISISEHDVFVDLGSGLGKLAAQVFLQSTVKQSIGIELIPELHQQALSAHARILQELPEFFINERALTFLQGSFFDIPFKGATIALISSPCFTPSMFNQLGHLIDAMPSIHTLLTLRPIPSLKRLVFTKVIRIEGSWDTALCYLYRALD